MKIKVSYTCGNYVWNGEPPYIEEPPICDSEGVLLLDISEKEWENEWSEVACPECGNTLSAINGNLKLAVIKDEI